MGRKVLITFLGTGGLKSDPSQAKKDNQDWTSSAKRQEAVREYRKANYRIGDRKYEGRSFISDALCDHYGIDTVFMIGTTASMWEEAYRVFNKKHGIDFVEDNAYEEEWNHYIDLKEHCENATPDSELELPRIEMLEKALGNDSKAVLIKYGLNEAELNENIATILGLEKYLRKGDELYVDITHGFRSIPMLMMNALIFLQNATSKEINIKNISYGMFEGSDKEGFAPVVDLTKMLEVSNWISGAHSFYTYGNANRIAGLLKEMDEPASKSASSLLDKFTLAKNLNNMVALKRCVQELSGIKFKELSPIARLTVEPVVKNFRASIGSFSTDSEFQYKLAKWQYKQHNYLASYITLSEALVTYICEAAKLDDITNQDNREEAKKFLRWQADAVPEAVLKSIKTALNQKNIKTLRRVFTDIYDIRNRLAHSKETNKSLDQIKQKLEDALDNVAHLLFPQRTESSSVPKQPSVPKKRRLRKSTPDPIS